MTSRVHVVLMWNWLYVDYGIPWAAAHLADAFRGRGLDPIFYIPFPNDDLPPGLPVKGGAGLVLRKALGVDRIRNFAFRRVERSVLRAVRKEGPGALVWIWPGASMAFLDQLRAAGAVLVREMVNTHRQVAKGILDREVARSGIASDHMVSEKQVEDEIAELERYALIVSPSSGVDESLSMAGIEPQKVLPTSFGWNPASVASPGGTVLPGKGMKAIFVGTVGVRKGAHLALAAWRKARIDGTFIIVGHVEQGMKPVAAAYGGDDIVFMPFTDDLASIYHGADFMFFPTLEEGAPLVCYQAAGCGCPIITTEMGSARIVVDDESGLIVDAHDEDGMVAALRRLAADTELRRRLGEGARRKAAAATWANAAEERVRLLNERLGRG